MKLFDDVSRGPLMDEAPAPAGGGDPPAGGAPGAFDPAAFKTEMMTEIRKDLNGIAKALKTDFSKMFKDFQPAPPAGDPPAPPPAPGDPPKPAVDPQLNAMKLEFDKFRKETEVKLAASEKEKQDAQIEAERDKREALVRTAIATNPKLKFVSEGAAATAFAILNPLIKRNEDGALIGNDLPFDKFIESEITTNHAYLLAPKEVAGGGGRPGKGAPGGTAWNIGPGGHLEPENFAKLTPQQKAELRQYIATAP